MFRKLTLIGFVLLLGVILAACSGGNENTSNTEQQPEGENALINQPGENDIVAKVNGVDIMGSTYLATSQQIQLSMQQQGQAITDENIAGQLHQYVIDSIVGNELILQDADKKGYAPEENQINEQLDQITGQFETDEELNAALQETNLTLDKLKAQIENDLIVQMYIDNEVELSEISDEQIKEVYDQATAQSEDAPKLEDVEPQIRESIKQQDIQAKMAQIVEDLKADSEIEILI